MNTITIATFNQVEPARPLQQRLENAGIHAVIHDESKLQNFVFESESLAGVRVAVSETDAGRAERLLAEWDAADHLLEQAVVCPECKSPQVEFPQITRKFLTPALGGLLFKLHIAEKEFYCHHCHHTWPLRVKVEPDVDLLNWPVKPTPADSPEARH